MRLLLDTHAFLWWANDDPRLSQRVRSLLADEENETLFSTASGWEIAIKAKLGHLELPAQPEDYIVSAVWENRFTVLPIHLNHALKVYYLPLHHRDPFDRLLLAQAQVEDLMFVSNDAALDPYRSLVNIVW